VTGSVFDRGKFKTPTLRNVERTAPYMHDGRFGTLEEVLEHYVEGVQRSPNLDPLLGVHLNGGGTGLPLTAQDRADLVAFLKTLTDPDFLANPDFGPPSP
jgi:cytochrome c peroxidase